MIFHQKGVYITSRFCADLCSVVQFAMLGTQVVFRTRARAWRFSGHFTQDPLHQMAIVTARSTLTAPELHPMLDHGCCRRLKRLFHRGSGSYAEAALES
jgi:hypothetical protein